MLPKTVYKQRYLQTISLQIINTEPEVISLYIVFWALFRVSLKYSVGVFFFFWLGIVILANYFQAVRM